MMLKKDFESYNPISFLNDSKLYVKYDFVVKNGVSNLIFEARVVVAGKTYYGSGLSKKEAKYEAAKNAVDDFVNCRRRGKNICRLFFLLLFIL